MSSEAPCINRMGGALFRTLENTRGVTITGEQLAEEVYAFSVVFFQDTYRLNIEHIFVWPDCPSQAARPLALRAQTGAEVQELVAASQLGATAPWELVLPEDGALTARRQPATVGSATGVKS